MTEEVTKAEEQAQEAAEASEQTPEECSGSCSSCGVAGCGSRTADPEDYRLPLNDRSSIKKVIAVVSGKGGVGKSLVTSLLASKLQKEGKKVAILDADITGPSIPKSFGVRARPLPDEDGINPVETPSGIKMISINLMLPSEDVPVAWRGPVITNALAQFWGDVNWGEIDVMLIDMPPGTSDVFLTIFQQLPIDGLITVSAPQDLVSMIVGKAVNLAGSMGVPVIGLVENMAYYQCDECGKRHHIFGEPQGEALVKKYDIEALATLPIDPQTSRLVDAGEIEEYDVGDALDPILEAIEKA